MSDPTLTPIPDSRRTLSGFDLAAIWFGAAIVISECWAGGLPPLAGLGFAAGLLAILIGRLIGNGLMSAMAGIGGETGLPTMVLTRPAFGVRGSALPAFFNVAQLIGWTAWMYFVAFKYLDVLAVEIGLPTAAEAPVMTGVWIGALALLCTVASFAGADAWHRVLKILAGAMVVLTVWMTVLIFRKYSVGEVLAKAPTGGTSLLAGTDLVVAMSVSWLPLVADYSRFAKSRRGATAGTFLGYFLGGTWMYAVGLLVAVAVVTDSPDQIVVKTMSEAGLIPVLLGILLVLVSTVTTTFLDVYSAAVSARTLLPRLPEKFTVIAVGIGSAALAVFLDVFSFEPFLLAIGAIFLPIFTIVLTHHYLLSGRKVLVAEIDRRGGAYWFTGGVSLTAVLAFVGGFSVFDLASGFKSLSFAGLVAPRDGWATGASLPCIAATAILYLAFTGVGRLLRKRSA
jgi:putative hydroxymethylpyrimidine transporter CytX